MTIHSHGYAGSASSEMEEAFLLFTENLDLIRLNSQKILDTAEYFFCDLPFAWCSWPYVGGDGPLCLGFLLLGWQDGIFIEPRAGCHSECLVLSFGGSPLSGSNSWSGICAECKMKKGNRDSVHKPFYKKLIFVTDLRKRFPQRIKRWEEYQGEKFSFAGDGLEPAIQKRRKTIELFESITLVDLIYELKENMERPNNNPESGIEGDKLGIKLSRR
jgi:hypothetical protein